VALTEKQRTEVVTDYAAGKSKTEIARKFGISDTAVSKILKKYKSLESKPIQTNPNLDKRDNKEIAKNIVSKAFNALDTKAFDKMYPETLLKIIERLTFLYGQGNDAKSKLDELIDAIKEAKDDYKE
jgi:transposase